uniref:alpha-glucosidase n=1 Tax=Corethrella appendiculata TaxID=1370023 RepID=U5ESA4_9DIPT
MKKLSCLISFIFIVINLSSVLVIVKCDENNLDDDDGDEHDKQWWKNAVIYQIYPRSFKDTNDDGVGDLQGIIEKLDHLKNLGVDAVWLSPIFKSPMYDFGYDISNFREIDEIFGTMGDFDELVAKAKELGLKIILDFVPNHTSDEHEWFSKSENRVKGYEDYYIWSDGIQHENGTREPPNNWVSVFRGRAWKWSPIRKQFYYFQFSPAQPDLNYRNGKVVEEMKNVLHFWLNKGVHGFRVDAVNHLMEVADLRNEPRNPESNDPESYDYVFHHYTLDLLETYDKVYEWRQLIDQLNQDHPDADGERIMMTEAYTNITNVMRYYQSDDGLKLGAHFPFNFQLVLDVYRNSNAHDFERVINKWMENMPNNSVANWVLGNHDRARVGSRFTDEKIDLMNTLFMTLPGVAVTYYGEEIGMVDHTDISFNDTRDPQACNQGEENYREHSRDPARTPFQWNGEKYSGFSNTKPWLPVHPHYIYNNLERSKANNRSNYHHYKKLVELRRHETFKHGDFKIKAISEDVLLYMRSLNGSDTFITAINFGPRDVYVDLYEITGYPSDTKVTVALCQITCFYRDNWTVKHDSLLLAKRNDAIVLRINAADVPNSGGNLNKFSLKVIACIFFWLIKA